MEHFFSKISLAIGSLLLLSLPGYGMEKAPEDFDEQSKNVSQATFSLAQNQQKASDKSSSGTSFNTLPIGLTLRIVDYLDYQDHFSLAQASRYQFFLWASIGRVPEAEALPIETPTPEATTLAWSDAYWPSIVNQTVIIDIDTDKDIEAEDLNRLNNISNLEEVLHLHFTAPEHKNLFINVHSLITEGEFDERLQSLKSLVFNGLPIGGVSLGVLLPNLQNLIIQGRAVPANWQERFPKWDIPGFPIINFINLRPQLRNIHFIRARLEKATLTTIVPYLGDFGQECSRLVEIRDNHLDLEGNPVHFEEPWYEGIEFILRPWTLDEEGNARIGYERDHFVPGPTRIRHLDVRLSEGSAHVPWYRFFHFLLPAYLSASDLLPLFRAWSTEDRLTALTRLIPESRIERGEEGALAFVLPSRLQEAFAIFWQREDSSQATASQQKEEAQQQRENTSTAHSQATSALDETVQVAASRHSTETIQVSMRDLIEAIRANAQSHSAVHSLLDQLPTLSSTRETLLGWFREVLEYFTGNNDNEIQEPNNAEILVGTQLMSILRSLAAK